MVIRNASFVQSVEVYVNANDEWMTDSETPFVTALFKAAEVLDNRTTASLLAEFTRTLKELDARKPQATVETKDEFDKLVEEFVK